MTSTPTQRPSSSPTPRPPPSSLRTCSTGPDCNQQAAIPTDSKESRFVPNKVEKTWLICTLLAYGAPLHKMKTLEATCARVANSAASRHISDDAIVREQEQYGVHWRRVYMRGILKVNVQYLVSTIPKLARGIPVETEPNEDGGPVAGIRDGCKAEGVERLFDQAVLDYKHEAAKRTDTTDDDAAGSLARRKKAREERQVRIEKRKADYSRVKKEKEEAKRRKQEERRTLDLQNLKAQKMTANAASASVTIAARQCEQFGSFLAMYAQRHNLQVTQPTTAMPEPLRTRSLELEEALPMQPSSSRTANDRTQSDEETEKEVQKE